MSDRDHLQFEAERCDKVLHKGNLSEEEAVVVVVVEEKEQETNHPVNGM